jgi:5-formyltetrahydrofolate cyclo-ligase
VTSELESTEATGNLQDERWRASVRERVWRELRRVARPDSRFHWDFAEFIPDFEGSDLCSNTVRELDVYRDADLVFVTPDNGLSRIREFCMLDGKDLLVSTYGIARGFLLVPRNTVPPEQAGYAATLDGLDYVGRAVTVAEVRDGGPLNLLITGASTISRRGIRFGKGHGYFDLEWGMFSQLEVVSEQTPVIGVVHDCQVIDIDLEPTGTDTVVDYIVTPSRILRAEGPLMKPKGVNWERLQSGMVERIPPLRELRELLEGQEQAQLRH